MECNACSFERICRKQIFPGADHILGYVSAPPIGYADSNINCHFLVADFTGQVEAIGCAVPQLE